MTSSIRFFNKNKICLVGEAEDNDFIELDCIVSSFKHGDYHNHIIHFKGMIRNLVLMSKGDPKE